MYFLTEYQGLKFRVNSSKDKVEDLIKRLLLAKELKRDGVEISFTAYKNFSKKTVYKKITKKVQQRFIDQFDEEINKLNVKIKNEKFIKATNDEIKKRLYWIDRLIGQIFKLEARKYLIENVVFEDGVKHMDVKFKNVVVFHLKDISLGLPRIYKVFTNELEGENWLFNKIEPNDTIVHKVKWQDKFNIFKEKSDLEDKVKILNCIRDYEDSTYSEILRRVNGIDADKLKKLIRELELKSYIYKNHEGNYKLKRAYPNQIEITIYFYIKKRKSVFHSKLAKAQYQYSSKEFVKKILNSLFEAKLISILDTDAGRVYKIVQEQESKSKKEIPLFSEEDFIKSK